MTIDEIVLLVKASLPNALTPLQEMVLRSSWEGKTYTSIAMEAHYGEERVRKVASNLWQLLSDFWKEPIHKSNFRSSLEPRRLTKAQQQFIQEFNRAATAISLEFPSGPVSLDSKFYIPRPPIEELAYTAITDHGSLICIKGSKKMGKSSLILRILAYAANMGYKTISLDFQQADKAVFTNLDKFLRWFCANVSRELGLEPKLNDYWDEEIGSKVSCSLYFQEHLLSAVENPLVLVLNEIDWVFEYQEIIEDFLPLLRSWYEQAKRVEVWQKLRLVLAYSTEIIAPLGLAQSPFNVGLPLKLPPFTKKQVQDLAQRHGLNWTDDTKTEKLMAMVGGHPYLLRLAFYHLVGKGGLQRDLGKLLRQAPTETGIYNEYLRQYALVLQEQPELASAFLKVIHGTHPVKLEPALAYKLQSMGLVNLDKDRCTPACELYRLYFKEYFETHEYLSYGGTEQLDIENQQLHILSGIDELTQLPTRRYFNTYLQRLWQHCVRERTFISLLLCDLDYFKYYNKTYGEMAGDNSLQQIASTICNCVKHILGHNYFEGASAATSVLKTSQRANFKSERDSVLVARYGGEKFAVLTLVDAAAAVHVAEYIREQVKALGISCEYPGIGGLPANVLTVSIGVACLIPEPDTESPILVITAEKALTRAKRRGRNCVVLG
jgi:diguanylate cyclase (GGDEF)-like protein